MTKHPKWLDSIFIKQKAFIAKQCIVVTFETISIGNEIHIYTKNIANNIVEYLFGQIMSFIKNMPKLCAHGWINILFLVHNGGMRLPISNKKRQKILYDRLWKGARKVWLYNLKGIHRPCSKCKECVQCLLGKIKDTSSNLIENPHIEYGAGHVTKTSMRRRARSPKTS